jgi:UDP-N-acetylglucosamine 2-epimerase (non-hydrolysing)
MTSVRPLLIFGTRPEAIKMAPVVHESLRRPHVIEPIVCLTGQHKEMLQQVTDYFGITADVNLDVMRADQPLSGLTARCLEGIDAVLMRENPDCIVAQGDTTTVMATAIAAFHRRVPLVHVEAGLRTHDLTAPWPEEFNRRVASLATAVHCAPTERSRQNLVAEGIDEAAVHVTGNTVVDALLWTAIRERKNNNAWEQRFASFVHQPFVLITGHRRENFGDGFQDICRAVATLSNMFPETAFVYPVHLNPNVQRPVNEILGNHANVHLLEPAEYPAFVWLMDRCRIILTDSGGVQEEAPSLEKPILVMRETTERPEAVDAGAVQLVGTSVDRIVRGVANLLTDEVLYASRQIDENPYGDGMAAARIVDLIEERVWERRWGRTSVWSATNGDDSAEPQTALNLKGVDD